MSKSKDISMKEFRENGYLQELNRQFLHPLGMAMCINIDDEGEESFSSIWKTDDEDGMTYAQGVINIEKSERVLAEQEVFFEKRLAKFGFEIQPYVGSDVEQSS